MTAIDICSFTILFAHTDIIIINLRTKSKDYSTKIKRTLFNNLKVYDDNKYMRKQKAFAIIDDRTHKNNDLVLCVDGVTPVYGNMIRGTVAYDMQG